MRSIFLKKSFKSITTLKLYKFDIAEVVLTCRIKKSFIPRDKLRKAEPHPNIGFFSNFSYKLFFLWFPSKLYSTLNGTIKKYKMSRKKEPSFSCVDGKFKRLWLLEEGDEKNGYEKNKNGPVLMGLILAGSAAAN